SGFQAMMAVALRKQVDVVVAESLDRFSRDQEDTAGLFKRLTFKGVRIITLAEGEITHLHVGLKGTMNALFLKDLADKTLMRRDLFEEFCHEYTREMNRLRMARRAGSAQA